MYWFTGTDMVHVDETRRFSSPVDARQKKMSLLQDDLMEILRPLADAGSAILR